MDNKKKEKSEGEKLAEKLLSDNAGRMILSVVINSSRRCALQPAILAIANNGVYLFGINTPDRRRQPFFQGDLFKIIMAGF